MKESLGTSRRKFCVKFVRFTPLEGGAKTESISAQRRVGGRKQNSFSLPWDGKMEWTYPKGR